MLRHRLGSTGVVVAVPLVLVALSVSAALAVPSRGAQTVSLGCASTVVGVVPNAFHPGGGNVVGGSVSWPVLRGTTASLPGARLTWTSGLGLAVKALAVVRAGATVRVVVPANERDRLSLYYIRSDPRRETSSGNVYRISDGERAVTLKACRRSDSQFAGYFIVARPQCALIEIYAGRTTHALKRQIPFGVPQSSCRTSL